MRGYLIVAPLVLVGLLLTSCSLSEPARAQDGKVSTNFSVVWGERDPEASCGSPQRSGDSVAFGAGPGSGAPAWQPAERAGVDWTTSTGRVGSGQVTVSMGQRSAGADC